MALPRNDMPMPDLFRKCSSRLADGHSTRAFSIPLTTPHTLAPPKHKTSSEGSVLVEHIRFTHDQLVVSYSGDEEALLSLTPEMVTKLRTFWARRIEEMAYRLMTGGGVPRSPWGKP